MNDFNQQPQQIRLDISQTEPVICDHCGNPFFTQVVAIRKVPGTLVGATTPQYVPTPTFACSKCGHVNSIFKPQEKKPESKITTEEED